MGRVCPSAERVRGALFGAEKGKAKHGLAVVGCRRCLPSFPTQASLEAVGCHVPQHKLDSAIAAKQVP